MAESGIKFVISNPKTGKTYQKEIDPSGAKKFIGMNVGGNFEGSMIGLKGYKLSITGGSDNCGFPLKKGVHESRRKKILMRSGIGYRPKNEAIRRKTVASEQILESTVQINTKIISEGKETIESLLGIETEPKEEEGKAENQ